ncbi:hypothetical protein [Mucilaginibacter sp.]|uniref:hypothetical protein n=1 Tax=Mucilaginibacter sp. TaxID=1882438 RepID=UPI003AFF8CE3
MEEVSKENPAVKLRAFRAIDEPKTCELFVKGHEYVLTSIGVTKVSSSKNEWTINPSVFVLTVESLNGKIVYGGARVHVAGGTQPLPIEQAVGMLDSKIYKLVLEYNKSGTGELCGLWHSREIMSYGIGSIFLIRAAVAISNTIGIQSLFALCAPYTIKPGESVGMEFETSVGNNGTFYYPKLDLIATAMILKDVPTLSKASEEDKAAIISIRKKPKVNRIEELRMKKIAIHYDLEIPHLEKWDLMESISNANNAIFR